MTWCGLHGHDEVVELFRQSLKQGRMASTFLFVGPPGVGKRKFAIAVAQSLLCKQRDPCEMNPCQACESCCQIAAGTHPDVEVVEKPADKTTIPIDAFIGDREHRNREGLCHRIALKPSHGHRRIAIINDADHLNVESANCLLKTLEEPPANAVIILVGTSEQRQLPTIRSRCQIIRFQGLDAEFVRDYLTQAGIDAEAAEHAAELAEGSLDFAREFADPERTDFRNELWSTLDQSNSIASQSLAKLVSDFVDAVGKETPKRREQLRHVIRLFLVFYRRQLYDKSRAGESTDRVATQIERCIQALTEVDANANLATLIECWVDDLYGSAVGPS